MKDKRLLEVFSDVVQCANWHPFLQESANDVKIDVIDIECFLDEYCIYRGDEQGFNECLADRVLEEYERRMGLFTCETDEAKDFLQVVVCEYLLDESPTLFKDWSLYQSMYDMISMVYVVLQCDDEYFVFDLSEADFTYDSLEEYETNIDYAAVKEIVKNKLE